MLHKWLKRKNRLISVSLFFVLFLIGCSPTSFVELRGQRITVEIADTPQERQQGLMEREELCDTCGMLFVFEEEGIYPFWMKNAVIPLDLLFIDKNGKLVDLMSVKPCITDPCQQYLPSKDIFYVLEVKGGVASQHHLVQGEQIIFSV